MSELNIGGSNMTVELRDNDTLYAKANTGNKQWVAVLTDTHPKYNYDREFVAYQKPKTSDRDSGTESVEDGAVIERVRYTHSGKNRKDSFYQLVDGEAHQIDEADVEAAIGGEIIPDVEEETHECEECGDEFDSEHGLAVHEGIKHSEDEEEADENEVQADGADTAVIADGGTGEIRSRQEVRQSEVEVRNYRAASDHLYAYREDDEHVVVARGSEPNERWTKRVPAERTAVVSDEQIWTVPDNWEQRLTIKATDVSRFAVYHIPETGVDVLVSVPYKNHIVDAWYGVKSVGELTVKYDDSCDWEALDESIEAVRDIDEVSVDIVEALEELSRRRHSFEREFENGVNMYAEEALLEDSSAIAPTLDGWTVDPWEIQFEIKDLVRDFLAVEGETLDGVMMEISEGNVVPSYPNVKVSVEDREGLPEGYDVQALVEAGCSPPEAVDYMMTVIKDRSQTDWGNDRGKDQSTISGNVSKAKRKLTA